MVILSLLWAIIASACVAVGLESPHTWNQALKGSVNAIVPKIMLTVGSILSIAVIVSSFYFLVTKNAIIVLATWVVLFALLRFIIEIMKRRNVYGDMPGADPYSYIKQGSPRPQRPAPEKHADEIRNAAPAEAVEAHKSAPAPAPAAEEKKPDNQAEPALTGVPAYDAIFERINAHAAASAPAPEKESLKPERAEGAQHKPSRRRRSA